MPKRKRQFLLEMAVFTFIARAGITQVLTSTNAGPSFVVPNTSPYNPQYPNQPDGRIAYSPDPVNSGEYERCWAGGNYVSESTSFTSQSGPLSSTDLLPGTPAPSYDQHSWLMSVYPVATLISNPSVVNTIAYPTVIGTSDVSMGQNAWLYSAVLLPSGSGQMTAEAVHLSKVTAVPIIYTGNAGDGNWASAGNWGGNAITDKGQSLIFKLATGSSQTNNLAAGTRVWGIRFSANAGANVITPSSGNTLELEGDFVNDSPPTQTYNGNIDQQSGLLFGNGGGYDDTQIIKNGTGTLILNGPGTFAGKTFINTLTMNQTGSSTFGGVLADTISPGTGQLYLIVTVAGTLTFSGTNDFSGMTRIHSGNPIVASNLARKKLPRYLSRLYSG